MLYLVQFLNFNRTGYNMAVTLCFLNNGDTNTNKHITDLDRMKLIKSAYLYFSVFFLEFYTEINWHVHETLV